MSKAIHWLRRCALPALLMTVTCAAVSAQEVPAPPAAPAAPVDTTTTTTSTTTTTTDTSTMAGGMTSAGMDMNGADYRLLNDPRYDYVDLKRAHRLGYTDSEIASISKISWMSGWSFCHVLSRVMAGRTFALLATDYGLKLSDVLNVTDEEARIARYLSLYESLNLLGTEHTAYLSTAQTISGPTLTELEARYNQLNAAFPALPPTNIETSQIGTAADTTTTTVAQAPPPPPPAPPPPAPAPPAPPAEVIHTEKTVVTHTHHVRRHRRHVVLRHRRHHVKRVTRMGS